MKKTKRKMCSSPTSSAILLGSICQFGAPGRGEESGFFPKCQATMRKAKPVEYSLIAQHWKNKTV